MCLQPVEKCFSVSLAFPFELCQNSATLNFPNLLAFVVCVCVLFIHLFIYLFTLHPASPEAVHPSHLSIHLPGNIIRELTTTACARRDLPHANAYSRCRYTLRTPPPGFTPSAMASAAAKVSPVHLCLRLPLFLFSL